MKKVTEGHIRQIKKAVAEEFPDDPAMQQVHVARKILAKEAQVQRLGFVEYVKSLRKEVRKVK
jgi:hypothetical protein